jgi:hypothetical protein
MTLAATIPDGPDLHDAGTWLADGERILHIARTWRWELGDWLLHGAEHHAAHVQTSTSLEGLEYRDIRDAAKVARAFPPGRRQMSLSWEHHHALAHLEPDQAAAWLQRAMDQGLTVTQMRYRVRQDTG